MRFVERLANLACKLADGQKTRRQGGASGLFVHSATEVAVWQNRMNRMALIDSRALQRATFVGVLLQAVTVLVAHFSVWVAIHASLFAAMMISAVSGYLYAQEVARGYGRGACGGAISGGVCGIVGIVMSLILGDASPVSLIVRALVSILTGAVGGIYGQMAADWP